MSKLEPPTPPALWNLWELIPWGVREGDGPRERIILSDVIAFELVGNVWFFTKTDRSVTAISLTDGAVYQVRPA